MSESYENFRKIDEKAEASKLADTASGYAVLLQRSELSLGLFAPRGPDAQSPHERDELYIVASGTGVFSCDGEKIDFSAGDSLFVAAGRKHRFESFSSDFRTWVIFFGPRKSAVGH